MSISEFMLLFLWVWSGFSFSIARRFFKLGGFFKGIIHFLKYFFNLAANNLVDKFKLFFQNKAAVVFSLIYVIHLLGVFISSDMDYTLKELRVKLPLILFPVIFATSGRIKYRQFRTLMLFYVAAVFAGTMVSVYIFLQKNFIDIREISPFISSIRFGLNTSFAIFTLVYFIFVDHKFKLWMKVIFVLVGIWFLLFILMIESVTSFTIIFFLSIGLLIYNMLKSRRLLYKLLILSLVLMIPLAVGLKTYNIIKKATTPPDIIISQLDKKTALGNDYVHDTISRYVEDGKYVGIYLCEVEMREAWNKRSDKKYYDVDKDGNSIKEGLIRYLTSKDLRKDYSGVSALSEWDIKMIENGCANVNYVKKPGYKTRILKIIKGYEVYKLTSDPSGSSVMQRLEYLKASSSLIKENWLYGVGTGDLEQALYKKYNEMGSKLKTEFRYHAHNQYFAIFIAFGIFGFIIFIVALIYPAIATKSFTDYFFSVFFVIITFSMLSDDTLETQAGVTLFAFFYSFLMFGKNRSNAWKFIF
ncbi:MAG: hypothetical protein C0598_04015 [Marinilabiliales bacterium]|nr:MAG: hypothetical protein C0598_04015 [Marinilabiliales bacterium]